MPVCELVAGAALGLALQVLHEAIKEAKDISLTTGCILDQLDATICRITPFVVQVEKLSDKDELRKVIEDLKHRLDDASSLVKAYANLRHRNLLEKSRTKRKIKELEASLRWMLDVDMQVDQWLDIKNLMAKMSEMNTTLVEITRQPSVIVEELDQTPEENDECSSDGSKPKIDIHLRWSSRKQNKDREIRFTLK